MKMAPGAVTGASTGQGWASAIMGLKTREAIPMLALLTTTASDTRWRYWRPYTRSFICQLRLCLNMKYNNNNNVRSSPSPMEPPHWPAHSGSQVRAGLTSGPWLGLWLWSLGLRQTTGSAETHHPPLAVTISRASRAVPSTSTPPSPSGRGP